MSGVSDTQTFALQGGLDLVTPPVQIPPGRAIAALNYEVRAEGYRRIEGMERLDGRTKPSDASYSVLAYTAGNTALLAGTAVVGGTSGATAILLVDQILTSGTFGGSNAAGSLILTEIVGTFVAAEAIKVGGVTKCTASGVPSERGALDDAQDTAWFAAAVLRARNAIQPVPGGGPIRGAWYFKGHVYAFRDDLLVAPTKCRMYQDTPTGWSLVGFGRTLPFTAGQAVGIVVGNTVTGSTSAATGLVAKVVVATGSFAANTAAGYLVLSAVVGVFVAETIKVGATVAATIAAAPTQITLPPGGRYEFVNENFYGAASQGAMYACNGVGPAFEWDGTNITLINTGAADERPIHLAAHRLHLFLAYRNGGLTGSESGLPLNYNGTLGATTFGFGAEITSLQSQLSGTMAVFGRTRISILSGSIAADFALAPFTNDAGAIEWTQQIVGSPTYLDDGGVRNLSTTQNFGDFKVGTLTGLIQPLLDLKKKAGIQAVASLRVRSKAQYRLFFSDNSGIAVFIGGKYPATLPFDLGMVARCTSSGLTTAGDEILLMGSDDGYVYQLDKGTSIDGGDIRGYLRLPFNHSGSPNQNKRYKKIDVQADAAPKATLFLTASFSDGDPDQPPVGEQTFDVRGGGGFWDEASWNQFYWSSRVKGSAEAHIDGFGNNISVTIGTLAKDEEPHTLHSLTLLYSIRGPKR